MYAPYRRVTQLATLLLMFLIPLLNLFEIYAVTGTFYAINIGGLGIADPVVILQAIFASRKFTVTLLSAALFPILLGLLFGRIWCGWLCPYHLLADAAAGLRNFVRIRLKPASLKERMQFANPFKANAVRFGFLMLGTVLAGAFAVPALNYVHAPGIISTEAMIFVKERSFSVEVIFIGLLLLLEISVLPRFWCRFFCPTGSLLSIFRGKFTLGIQNDLKTPKRPCCTENHCSAACPMGLGPFKDGKNLLCTNCGLCIDACASKRLKFGGFKLG